MKNLICFLAAPLLAILTTATPVRCQARIAPGQLIYERNCGTCHGGDGLGGEMGPNIAGRLTRLTDEQLSQLLLNGRPTLGKPLSLRFCELSGRSAVRLRFNEPSKSRAGRSSQVWF